MDTWGWVLYLVPKNLLSLIVGIVVSLPLPNGLRIFSMKWFAKRYNINMDEAEKNIEEYKSINDLFTRKLKPGIRPIASSNLVHPADSEITVAQKIKPNQFIQAKGKSYSLTSVAGGGFVEEGYFEEGYHLTYYLCPTDYHRVHSPVDGKILGYTYLPGRLWPVNPWSVEHVSQLFAVNERVTIWIESSNGVVGVNMVGATNVGKITLAFDQEFITNNKHFRKDEVKKYDQPISVKKGDELGTFNMGSTVLLFLPKSIVPEAFDMELPQKVKYGAKLL